MLLRVFVAAVIALAFAAHPVFATPQDHDGTDMWFNAAEQGWGANIYHQGDTLFVCLFLYGPDGQPKWYVAPSVTGGADGGEHDQPARYNGALYETTGPWFGGAFDPNAVTVRQVGDLVVVLSSFNTLLDFTIDGVHVSKSVDPFTFRYTNLTGTYIGFQYQPAFNATPEVRRDQHIFITDDGTNVNLSDDTDSCHYIGRHGQNGQIETVTGTYSCAASTGSWGMRVDATPDGFVGSFSGNGINNFWGRIVGSSRKAPAMTGNGWRTDNWFPPAESGWGVNIVEQGDTIFATLFVYDQQRRPHWYVASNLTQSGSGVTAGYNGALYDCTGPYFGAPFDPSAVHCRVAGSMSFQETDNGSGGLSYTIDGVTVTKPVSRYYFRKNDLSGTYVGHLVATNSDTLQPMYQALTISIADADSGFTMHTAGSFSSSNCDYSGQAQQHGAQKDIGGTFTCGDGRSGPFTMQNVVVTFSGFTGSFQGNTIVGHMEGARTTVN